MRLVVAHDLMPPEAKNSACFFRALRAMCRPEEHSRGLAKSIPRRRLEAVVYRDFQNFPHTKVRPPDLGPVKMSAFW